jgi:hypothetical protein
LPCGAAPRQATFTASVRIGIEQKKIGSLLLQFIELLEPSLGLRLRDDLPPDHKGLNQPSDLITEAVSMIGPIDHGDRYLPEWRETGLATFEQGQHRTMVAPALVRWAVALLGGQDLGRRPPALGVGHKHQV